MKITFRLFLYFTVSLFSKSVCGQHRLTNPLICHDKDNYLRCYNDGNYILTFGNGNFKEFRTSDNSLKYSEVDKTIVFIHERRIYGSLIVDTIQLIQLPKSIILKKRSSSLEITSLKEVPKEIEEYGVGWYSIDNVVRGLTFWSGDKYVELEVWTYGKTWSWTIIMKDKQRRFAVDYNSYRNNRVEHIFIQDDSLRYGMGISMTFKTLKKIWRLESSYVDTVRTLENGTPVIGRIPLDKYYRYEYNKAGKLKTENRVGELKLCDCN
jgi:hypothetical protein